MESIADMITSPALMAGYKLVLVLIGVVLAYLVLRLFDRAMDKRSLIEDLLAPVLAVLIALSPRHSTPWEVFTDWRQALAERNRRTKFQEWVDNASYDSLGRYYGMRLLAIFIAVGLALG